MNIGSALGLATRILNQRSSSPALDAEVLLAWALKKDRAWLLAHDSERLPWMTAFRYYWFIIRRRCGRPVAYLTGEKEFYGRKFYVDRRVLIPRPDTELIIENALGTIRANGSINTVVDVGTGSGCIAITLACELPNIKLIATDISSRALKVARKNTVRHGVTDRITFLPGNLLEPLRTTSSEWRIADNWLLIANLPYLRTGEIEGELRLEPMMALDGGSEGMACYRELLTQVKAIPQEQRPSWLALELHPPTADYLAQLVKKVLPDGQLSVENDYAGRPRALTVHLAKNN